jgi:hypothetical protein
MINSFSRDLCATNIIRNIRNMNAIKGCYDDDDDDDDDDHG